MLERTRQQKRVLEHFEKNGPAVTWRHGYVVKLELHPRLRTVPVVTDTELRYLRGLRGLEELSLSGTGITDAGVSHLKGLTNLTRLYLFDTGITDAGLPHLRGLTNLEYLGLTGTHVTSEGMEELRRALPNCEIVWNEGPWFES